MAARDAIKDYPDTAFDPAAFEAVTLISHLILHRRGNMSCF